MYRDLSKYVNEVFTWLGSAPEDPAASLFYYVSEVRIECDGNAVGTFTLDFDNEYDFKAADTWDSVPPATPKSPAPDPFVRSLDGLAVAIKMLDKSNEPMPVTNDPDSFVHGYTHAMADIFKILGYTPEDFEGVRLPGPKGAL